MASNDTLGPHLDGFIAAQVALGRYADASEVTRAALRLLEAQDEQSEYSRVMEIEHLARIKTDIQNAVDSPKVDGDEAMKGLYARIAERNGDKAVHEAA